MKANATINVSVTSHYAEPSYQSEVVAQGLLGERVEILEEQELFTKIRQADEYESWVSEDQVVREEQPAGKLMRVREHFLRIFNEPDNRSAPVREAVIGSDLIVTSEQDGWCKLALPGGLFGWAEQTGFGSFPEFSPENVVLLAREFLGYQYSWGGSTPKGFDCSGFVQTVFKLLGVALQRDAWQQQQKNLISENFHDAAPGDLVFFSKTPAKVTHVGISLGNLRFIHASGWVKINSFDPDDPDYSEKYVNTFTSVNRYSAL